MSTELRNRWFHKAKLHSPPHGTTKGVSWLELFYDLIFVAAFIQLGNGLSEHVTFKGFISFSFLFGPIWLVWFSFSEYMGRFSVGDALHRTLTFFQMFAVGGMAIAAPAIQDGDHQMFAGCFALCLLFMVLMYIRIGLQLPVARRYSYHWAGWYALAAICWATSTLIPFEDAYVLFGLGTLFVFIPSFTPAVRGLNERYPIDEEHQNERFALLTMVVLGESFVKVLDALSGQGTAWQQLFEASVLLLITCSIFWLYFDNLAGAHLRGKRFQHIMWVMAHLPLQLAITASGVGIKKAVLVDMSMVMPEKYRWLLCETLGLTMVALAAVDSVTDDPHTDADEKTRVGIRMFAGFLLLSLPAIGGTMPAYGFLAGVLGIFIAQVILDLLLSPLQEAGGSAGELLVGNVEKTSETASGRPFLQINQRAVRKGAPSHLKKDIFFYFMEGSWSRFWFGFFGLVFVLNVMFASLYLLAPGSIQGLPSDSLTEAFFFSVQTFSSMGLGDKVPTTLYGNIIVSLEVMAGLVTFTLTIGLVLAKITRPRSQILFSDTMVINNWNGLPTLQFRAGNARGNEVVEASATVTLIRNSSTVEGHTLKRLIDLKLMRKSSPVFSLTWQIMHTIDAASPVRPLLKGNELMDGFDSIVVVLNGYDAVLGKRIYSRHVYTRQDIKINRQFVEFSTELEDGRILFDFTQFHATAEIAEDHDAHISH